MIVRTVGYRSCSKADPKPTRSLSIPPAILRRHRQHAFLRGGRAGRRSSCGPGCPGERQASRRSYSLPKHPNVYAQAFSCRRFWHRTWEWASLDPFMDKRLLHARAHGNRAQPDQERRTINCRPASASTTTMQYSLSSTSRRTASCASRRVRGSGPEQRLRHTREAPSLPSHPVKAIRGIGRGGSFHVFGVATL